nr:MAG TPA: hypothetical protein [Crassvirales sp.]
MFIITVSYFKITNICHNKNIFRINTKTKIINLNENSK